MVDHSARGPCPARASGSTDDGAGGCGRARRGHLPGARHGRDLGRARLGPIRPQAPRQSRPRPVPPGRRRHRRGLRPRHAGRGAERREARGEVPPPGHGRGADGLGRRGPRPDRLRRLGLRPASRGRLDRLGVRRGRPARRRDRPGGPAQVAPGEPLSRARADHQPGIRAGRTAPRPLWPEHLARERLRGRRRCDRAGRHVPPLGRGRLRPLRRGRERVHARDRQRVCDDEGPGGSKARGSIVRRPGAGEPAVLGRPGGVRDGRGIGHARRWRRSRRRGGWG